ncbi:MAG: sporulation transcriptional regulator SpoIIID [Clostridia bacterium]|nr:sporulation transcriptional regulator SpoIIID [Clostridia bacterium]
MKAAIERRVIREAEYIAAHGATVRETARVLGVSKSTVHKDMETRIAQLSRPLAEEVAAVFQKNKAERHIRGGEATRRRYERIRLRAGRMHEDY